MPKEGEVNTGSRWTYLDGSIRLIDASNSRMALEVDLGLLPWDPFNALGKQVTVLIPTPQEWGEAPRDDDDDLERSLRFVVHAADRCKEFAQNGNGDKSDWWAAFQTWDWLRKHLTARLAERSVPLPDEGRRGTEETPSEQLPNLPGAASVLGYTLGALRSIPLDHWEKTVSTLDPEAPSREEAIQTLLGLSKLLKGNPTGNGRGGEPAEVEATMDPVAEEEARAPAGPSADSATNFAHDQEEVSFDYAAGFDEGYSLGRKVGFALGSHAGKKGRNPPEGP